MTSLFSENKRFRRNFAKNIAPIEMPDLVSLQRRSYAEFLQAEVMPDQRKDQGLYCRAFTCFHVAFLE